MADQLADDRGAIGLDTEGLTGAERGGRRQRVAARELLERDAVERGDLGEGLGGDDGVLDGAEGGARRRGWSVEGGGRGDGGRSRLRGVGADVRDAGDGEPGHQHAEERAQRREGRCERGLGAAGEGGRAEQGGAAAQAGGEARGVDGGGEDLEDMAAEADLVARSQRGRLGQAAEVDRGAAGGAVIEQRELAVTHDEPTMPRGDDGIVEDEVGREGAADDEAGPGGGDELAAAVRADHPQRDVRREGGRGARDHGAHDPKDRPRARHAARAR